MTDLGDVDIEIRGQRRPDGVAISLAAVRALAERQHGVVCRDQLLRVIGRGAIDHAVRTGWLVVVHRGVYAVGHRALRRDGWLLAAVMAGGDGAALSHSSAAELWGIGPVTPRIEISVPRSRRWDCESVLVHRPHRLSDDIVSKDGIAVTSIARTLMDLASRSSVAELRRMLNSAEYERLADRWEIADRLARSPRARGARKLRRVLATSVAPSRSELERRFHQLLATAGLRAPRRNSVVEIRGERFEVDAWWPDARLVVELDGFKAHGTKNRFELDRRRDEIFVAADIRVVRVTWQRVTTDARDLLQSLRQLLAAPGRR